MFVSWFKEFTERTDERQHITNFPVGSGTAHMASIDFPSTGTRGA
jgi:hypothetical protein